MDIYFSYIFIFIYFSFTTIAIYVYIHYMYSKDKINENFKSTNLKLINKKLLTSNKYKKYIIKNRIKFPKDLYKYIKKPDSGEIANLLLTMPPNINNTTDNDIQDIYRAITISSLIFNEEIPLYCYILDDRTKELYHMVMLDLKPIYVIILDFFNEKIKEIVSNDIENYNFQVETYNKELIVVGTEIIEESKNNSFPSLEYFTDKINKKYNKSFNDYEVQSIATAFSAISNIKIPAIYINLNIISLSLINFTIFKFRGLNEK